MKKYGLTSIVILIALAWGLSSCGDSNNSYENRPIMTAMVNSANWRCPDPHARISENSITVYGTSANGQTLQIIILSGEKGEFDLTQTSGHIGKYTPNMSSAVVSYSTDGSNLGTGRVLISSINEETRTISGQFNFKAYRPSDGAYKIISDGSFTKVPYKFINTIDTTIYANELQGYIDGVQWVPQSVSAIKNDTAIIITGNIPQTWESMKLILPDDIASGVHYITIDGPVYSLYQEGFYSYQGTSGSLTVNEHDTETHHIMGSFFFNFIDNDDEIVVVNSGVFDIYYNNQMVE